MTKIIDQDLFDELRRLTGNIATGWKLIRKTDGLTVGFTSSDVEFTFESVLYTPLNSFSGTAAVARSTLSVDNMSAVVLYSDLFTERDIKGGRWDGSECQVFWICPDHPEWGSIPIRGGKIGELKLGQGRFETELRSILQQLQQPTGHFYTLDCQNMLGDVNCKVIMDAPVWAANTRYDAKLDQEAQIGSVVKPTVFNGKWYVCIAGSNSEERPWGNYTQYSNTGGQLYNADQSFGSLGVGSPVAGSLSYVPQTKTVHYGSSGGTQPTWPTNLGGEVNDGSVTWKAIFARRYFSTVIDNLDGDRMSFKSDIAIFDHFFQFGILRWVTGANSYLMTEIRDYSPTGVNECVFHLLDVMPEIIQNGDQFEAIQGCSKTRSVCSANPWDSNGFSNLHNIWAYPDMPIETVALSTPVIPHVSQTTQSNDDGS